MYKQIIRHSDKLFGMRHRQSGLTILEMTVVILVLLTLAGISFFAMSGYREWQRGSEGSRVLRMVYNAQRTYLAEHPIESPSALTAEKIIPYLSNGSSALPTAQALDDSVLEVDVTVSPPVLLDSNGNDYDPSGDTNDGLWDVGG
ncbi:MAG: type II secretion system protein [Akkermansiaceae bacterium]|nr:type II secretion system protein [Akkermansiaceae bacterium]